MLMNHRYMPPTTPCGMPTIAIVFARLFVGDEDRGIKPFLVHLHDGRNMSDGIVTRQVGHRFSSLLRADDLSGFFLLVAEPALLAMP
jgi:hypothetical protein